MKRVRLQPLTSTIGMLIITIFSIGAYAQQQPAPNKETQPPPQGNTVDAWRNALPESEKPLTANEGTSVRDNSEESFEQIEKRINALERRWMEAIKRRDADALKRILSDDFTLTSVQPVGVPTDKTKYIESALRDWQLNNYSFEKLRVRVYGNTAVVNALYKQQAIVAGKEWNGDFLVTDVWVKQNKLWRVVTRHSSQSTITP